MLSDFIFFKSYHEALKTGAIVSQLAKAIQSEVNNFFTDGVMSTGKIVGGIFFAGDQLLGMEELSVGVSADLVVAVEFASVPRQLPC